MYLIKVADTVRKETNAKTIKFTIWDHTQNNKMMTTILTNHL